MNNKNKFLKKTIIASLLVGTILLSGCSTRGAESSAEPSTSSSVSSQQGESSAEQSEVSSETPESSVVDNSEHLKDSSLINFSVIKDNFFGSWTAKGDDSISIGYGENDFGFSWQYVSSAYVDEEGNAVMKVINGGEPYEYKVDPKEPDTLLVASVNDSSVGDIYTKIKESPVEPTDIFGYFDELEYCIGKNPTLDLMDPQDTPFTLFNNLTVTLEDGSAWQYLGNMEVAYPPLYLVEKEEASITLRTALYPESTELTADNASDAKEIIVTIAYDGTQWQVDLAKIA